MSTLKVNELRHLSNSGTANLVLESNATTNLQATSTLGLTVNGTLTVSGVGTFNGNVIIGNASTDTLTLTSTVSGSANYSGFTGEIRMYAGNAAGDSPPAGWLYCNGDEISQTSGNGGDHHNSDGTGNDYQALFNLLKASEDWGNTGSLTWGTNKVKLPDFRSRSPVGIHTGSANSISAGLTARTLGDTVGTETHTMVTAEMPAHTHVMTCATANTSVTAAHSHTHAIDPPNTTTSSSGSHTHTVTQGYADGSEENHGLGAAWGGQGVFDSSQHVNSAGAHTHTLDIGSFTSGAASTATVTVTDPGHNHTVTAASTGSGNAHTILSPIIAVNYIIKV